MTFENWVLKTCFKEPSNEAHDLASAAWKESEHEAVHDVLKKIAGNTWQDSPFKGLMRATCNRLVDDINIALSDTGWFFVVCGDGLAVRGRNRFTGKIRQIELAQKVFEAM